MLVKIKIKKKLPLPKLKSSSNSTNYALPFFNSVQKKNFLQAHQKLLNRDGLCIKSYIWVRNLY